MLANDAPQSVLELERRWSLTLGLPFPREEGSVGWVAPVTRADGTPAVLKIGMPHFEAEHEAEGLRFWAGEPTVRLLDADESLGALLLERCEPGTSLRELPEPEQDRVIAGLLQRLWRSPSSPHRFRPLAALLSHWAEETLAQPGKRSDEGMVQEGLRLFRELPRSASSEMLLATDLHAGNVLRAQREPWLVIDPKPFVGDPAYDATQHLLNCMERLRSDPRGTIRRFSDLLEVDDERVRLWTFARLAAEPHVWSDDAPTLASKIL
jgi:streptomycin 6-kinase